MVSLSTSLGATLLLNGIDFRHHMSYIIAKYLVAALST
jgi:hypothetical protein